jgi:hypothetical protein
MISVRLGAYPKPEIFAIEIISACLGYIDVYVTFPHKMVERKDNAAITGYVLFFEMTDEQWGHMAHHTSSKGGMIALTRTSRSSLGRKASPQILSRRVA